METVWTSSIQQAAIQTTRGQGAGFQNPGAGGRATNPVGDWRPGIENIQIDTANL